jgi:hypothetical protein
VYVHCEIRQFIFIKPRIHNLNIIAETEIKKNCKFDDYVDVIYPTELDIKDIKETVRSASYLHIDIKDITDTATSASYLHIHIEIEGECRLITKLDHKRDYLNFVILNFPFICSNIPAEPAYGVNISQLTRYSRACGTYHDFLDRGLLLTRKLQKQGFLVFKLMSSLSKFYSCHHFMVYHDRKFELQITKDMFCLLLSQYCPNKWNTSNITNGSGTAYPSGATEVTPGFFVWFVLLNLYSSV